MRPERKITVRTRIDSHYSFWMSGSGLLWCWGFLRFFWSQSTLAGHGGSVLDDLPYLGSTLLVSLVAAFVAASPAPRRPQTSLATLGCALLVLGIVASFVFEAAGANASGLQMISDVAQGGGIGAFFIAWGYLYVRSETEAVECAFLGWFPLLVLLLAAAAGINLLEQGATIPYSCLLLLLPLASLFCFRKSVRHVDAQGEGDAPLGGYPQKAQDESAPRGSVAWPLINLVFVFASISLAWNAFLFRAAIRFETSLIMFAVSIAALFVIVWLALRMTRRFSLSTLYGWALPLFAVGTVLFQFSETAYFIPVFLCLSVVNTGFEVMGKLFCIYIAKRNPKHATGVIAIGFATASMGGILGSCMWAGVLDRFGTEAACDTLLVALVAFVFAASLAPEKDPGSQGAMSRLSQDRLLFRRSHWAGDSAGPGRCEAGGETFASAEPDGIPGRDGAATSGGERDSGELGAAEDRLAAKCLILAEEYGLSSRELEVLILLSQGRSRAHIRETLYISKGTVDSHIHHVYSKMGISSKDELMRQLLD